MCSEVLLDRDKELLTTHFLGVFVTAGDLQCPTDVDHFNTQRNIVLYDSADDLFSLV